MKHIVLAVACAALLTAPALGDWSDNFESYPANANLKGLGGWLGWDGGDTASYVVADPHSAGVQGLVARLDPNQDLTKEFTTYTSGAWVFTTKMYIPVAAQGVAGNGTYFILMNKYPASPHGWAAQLHFDLANGRVWDDQANSGNVPIVFGEWATIRVEIDLDANLRTTYYNGTFVGMATWYVPGDTTVAYPSDVNQTKSVAALDLWSDQASGGYVYYDDLSLVPGTPLVQGKNISTYGSREARYLSALGREWGDTIVTGTNRPNGLFDIANAGGNQSAWWFLNNGSVGEVMVTFGGSNPDYVGLKFRLPATIKTVAWWNLAFGDGGTFAAAPALQYLDAPNGNWHTVADVTWNRSYDNDYTTGHNRSYIITLNTPVTSAWGIRLLGDAQPGVDDDGAVDGSGFVGVTELVLYGDVQVGNLDLATNLAATGTAIANYWEVPVDAGALNDGFTGNMWGDGPVATTYHPNERDKFTGEDYLGITWTTPQNRVSAIGWVTAWRENTDANLQTNDEGGLFDPCNNLRVQVAKDAALTNWVTVTGLDLGQYPACWLETRSRWWNPQIGWLFRFDPQDGVYGIRLIGDPDSTFSKDLDGWVGAWEFEVFANKATSASAAKPATPTVASRVVESIKHVWSRVAL